MRKLKNISLTLAVSFVLLINITGCSRSEEVIDYTITDNKPKVTQGPVERTTDFYNGGNLLIDLVVNFNNIDKLKESADVIAEVEILENKYIEHGGLPFTISKARVISKSKGEVKEGDTIGIMQTGGILNGSELKVQGLSVMKPGDHMFLFMQKYMSEIIDEDAYHYILGEYQGRFKIFDNNSVVNVSPVKKLDRDYLKEKNKNLKFTEIDLTELEPIDLETLKKEIYR